MKSAAQSELAIGENKLQVSFGSLDTLIRRMTTLPGQRIVVLMSPGFFVTPQMYLTQDFIDKATKAGLVVNIIDARGVCTSSIHNGSTRMNGAAAMPMRPVFVSNEESVKSQFLEELADGTGGSRFENHNDTIPWNALGRAPSTRRDANSARRKASKMQLTEPRRTDTRGSNALP